MADRNRLHDTLRYPLSIALAIMGVTIRGCFTPLIGDRYVYSIPVIVVAVCGWYLGVGPGLSCLALSGALVSWFWVNPTGSFWIDSSPDIFGLLLFFAAGLVFILIGHRNRLSETRLEETAREAARQREWLRVTLLSIVDAVITTDVKGCVTFLNSRAESLTGWTAAEAEGRLSSELFTIVDNETSRPLSNPVERILREEKSTTTAANCMLITRDDSRRQIESTAAPIRDADGSIVGVVMTFRDLTEKRAADLALAETQTRYRLLSEGVDQVVWTINSEGRLEYLNQHWFNYTGLDPDASFADNGLSVVHPDDLEGMLVKWKSAIASGESFEFEFRLHRYSDDSYRWHLGRLRPIRGADGRIYKWLGTALDIEDRKRSLESLTASEERLRLAMRSARMGTWNWDIASDRVSWSTTLEEIHGIAPGTFPGTFEAFRSDIHPEDRDLVFSNISESLNRHTEYHVEYRLVWPDESVHWVEARGMPMLDQTGKPHGMIGLCIDVTERRRSEEGLREALQLAENASRAKDQFLAMLSHELRTPLTPIMLAANEMLSDSATPHSHLDMLMMIRQNIELEVRLIDDLLDVMRIIRGKMPYRFEIVDLHDLLYRTLDICKGEIESKKLVVRRMISATRNYVQGDPARLQQLLWNLIKNAVKFTPEHGSITIQTRSENGRIAVEISDTGVGIEQTALPRIFNAFEQEEDAVTGRFGGLGLGLAISKSIVEAHGGELIATSAGKGHGSTFCVQLALVESGDDPERPDPPSALENPEANGLRILLVEDDPMTARIMARLLRHNGYTVTTASTLASALAVSPDEVDLLVSDIGLPDGSGLDLMRKFAEFNGVRGIALTGFGREDDIRKSREAGYVAHLTKPVDFARLDAMIRQVSGMSPDAGEPSIETSLVVD